jgi:hypothetical protein
MKSASIAFSIMNYYIRALRFGACMFGLFGLTEKEKYEITSWAFSYFMTRSLTVSDAVIEAVKKIKPDKVKVNGSLKLSKSAVSELELRVKNML